MTSTFVFDAVRTPFGRAGGTLSATRPDDLAALVMAASGPVRHRRCDFRRREPGGRGQPQRRAIRCAARPLPDHRHRHHRKPVVRIQRRGGGPRLACDRSGRCPNRAHGWCRVHEPGAIRRGEVAETVAGGRQPDAVEYLHRMADDQPGTPGALDDLQRGIGREGRTAAGHHPGAAGRVRGAQS